MGSITPVFTREQRRMIKAGEVTDEEIERWKRTCKTWKLEVSCGKDRNGRRIRPTKTVHCGKRQAYKEMSDFEAYWGKNKVEDRTLKAQIDDYIGRKEGVIAASSINALRVKANTLLWLFGEKTRLSKLTPKKIDEGFHEMIVSGGPAGKPCKPAYVGSLRSLLNSILADALRRGYLARDPMPETQKYKSKAEKRRLPQTDALEKIAAYIDPRDYRQMAVLLVVKTGMRRQEAVALRFDDIDVEQGRIHVRRTVRTESGVEAIVDCAKTESGVRDIPLPESLVDALKTRRATLEADIDAALRSGRIEEAPSELYVCANDFGQRTSLTSVTKWWCNHRSGLGLTCSLHDLRHLYITRGAELGINPAFMAALSGHSDVSTTLNVYTHASWDNVVDAVEAINGEKAKGVMS